MRAENISLFSLFYLQHIAQSLLWNRSSKYLVEQMNEVEHIFIFPSHMRDNLAKYKILGSQAFPFKNRDKSLLSFGI